MIPLQDFMQFLDIHSSLGPPLLQYLSCNHIEVSFLSLEFSDAVVTVTIWTSNLG